MMRHFKLLREKKSLSQINISKLSKRGYVILLINVRLAYSSKKILTD